MKSGIAGSIAVMAAMGVLVSFANPVDLHAQRGRGGGQAAAGRAARASAPYDLTGYWVSVVSEDWKYHMVTPPKGEYGGVPISAEGRKVADSWDPAKDESAGQQCKAYGAAGIMRIPGRLHITWENDNTLRIDADAGTQTRLLQFSAPPGDSTGDLTWQGRSIAQWETAGGRGTRFAEGTAPQPGGFIKVVTTRMRPGYLRKNGVPYSANATMTEYFEGHLGPNGEWYLVVSTIIEDPQYLSQPYVTSANFKKLRDASGWSPTSCSAK
jgi:hypothetical protein